MKIQHALVGASFALVLHAVTHAAPATYRCPQSIPEASVQLTAPGQEWQPFISSPLYLSSAAPADGPPARLGVLRENVATKTKAGWTRKYALNGRFPDGKWLRCDYGAYGEASLAKRLPDETQECTVTEKKGDHAGENNVDVRCL
jgi:hypothetical protein